MNLEKARGRVNWALPAGTAAAVLIISAILIVWTPYAVFPLLFVLIPLVCLTLLVLLLVASVRKSKRLQISSAIAFAVVIAISFGILRLHDSIRESLRWLLWSNRFKSELMALPSSPHDQLKHMEWEATGFAGVANDTLYLVLDPTDSLAPAARSGSPGKFTGLPCEVLKVRRLEAHWYAIRFYTDEAWGERNQLDCSMKPSP
jgi:hypothetical protein